MKQRKAQINFVVWHHTRVGNNKVKEDEWRPGSLTWTLLRAVIQPSSSASDAVLGASIMGASDWGGGVKLENLLNKKKTQNKLWGIIWGNEIAGGRMEYQNDLQQKIDLSRNCMCLGYIGF